MEGSRIMTSYIRRYKRLQSLPARSLKELYHSVGCKNYFYFRLRVNGKARSSVEFVKHIRRLIFTRERQAQVRLVDWHKSDIETANPETECLYIGARLYLSPRGVKQLKIVLRFAYFKVVGCERAASSRHLPLTGWLLLLGTPYSH